MVRMTLEEASARPLDIDRERLDATIEEDIRNYQIADGFDPDSEIPDAIDGVVPPREIRARFGTTQEVFARMLGITLASYRNWEQGRTIPPPALRVPFRILAREPEAALRALQGGVT